MTEQDNQEEQEDQQEFGIHSIYLKDVSFESPNAPEIFTTEFKPEIQMGVNIDTSPLGDDVYEVVLSITVSAKAGEKTGFLVELHQAGIFTLKGFNEETLGPMLGIYCPNVLFPYARESTASLVTKGGFPQLLLEPVNFEAMYAQHQENQQGTIQ
ncbi:MAG TPA: protein-export chaperone SecB [Gammaproteobacteria bacterium]|nr:protein-export chaperone SecB [Gammaproteobacteria bacterium]